MKKYQTCRFVALLLAGCGDNARTAAIDAAPLLDGGADAAAPDSFVPLVRVFGHIEAYGQPAASVHVSTLEGPSQTTTSDLDGNFYFDVPDGARLIVKADAAAAISGSLSMIRGVIAHDHLRVRNFYIVTEEEVAAAQSLGVTFDPTLAIAEIDFRNAAIGGYTAALTGADGMAVDPSYGIVADEQGQPQLGETTIAGGDGSTLLLGGLRPGPVSFAASVPAEATLPCQARDAMPLPLERRVVTWFDYECGTGED